MTEEDRLPVEAKPEDFARGACGPIRVLLPGIGTGWAIAYITTHEHATLLLVLSSTGGTSWYPAHMVRPEP